jgi:tetratricopeptide (TPR) repeat protein
MQDLKVLINGRTRWVLLLLPILAILPYYGIWTFDFVTFDDPQYIFENPQVTAGLTLESIVWAFTSGHASNWHPITWISHMLDVEWFGLDAGRHHLGNVLIHALNTLLLFGFLAKATEKVGRSALVAVLFAVHPLHVESVAWISERKDVLSTLFMLLTMWAWLAYISRKSIARYLMVFLFLLLGLMSKPMLVTLPFVLLLLDAWPLGRIKLSPFDFSMARKLVWEKLPLMGLVLASSIVTVMVQSQGGAVAGTDAVGLFPRLSNAVVSYVSYIGKMFAPTGLAALYPFPDTIPVWKIAGSLALLLAATFGAWKVRNRFAYLTVGWLWYIGTLIPVIGIVQVGSQSMADRYTYIPLIGLFVVLSWGSYDLLVRNSSKKAPLIALVLLLVGSLTGASYLQARHWENSETLWQHTLDVTSDNYRAHTALGSLLEERGQTEAAVQHYQSAIRINPSYLEAQNKLGAIFSDGGRANEAIELYQNILRTQPNHPLANINMGNALAAIGSPEKALVYYRTAVAVSPDNAFAHNGLGSALDDLQHVEEAIEHYQTAIEINPDFAAARNNLAAAFYKQKNYREGLEQVALALALEPDNASFHTNHAVFMIMFADFDSARENLANALRLSPGYQPALDVLAKLPKTGNE